MTAWGDWAVGVLQGKQAPVNDVNLITLYNWSVKESGLDVMRWNNPLNTTWNGFGGISMNSAGVKKYPTIQDGIDATLATLGLHYYGNIVGALQTSLPHSQWSIPAICQELDIWGTRCDWTTMNFIPVEADVLDQGTFNTLVSGNEPLQAAIYRIEALFKNLPKVDGGPDVGEINELNLYLVNLQTQLDAIKAAIPNPSKSVSGSFEGTVS